MTPLDSYIEVRNFHSSEVTRRVNQMESHLIQIDTSHLDI